LYQKEVSAIAKEIEKLDARERQLNEKDAMLSMKQQGRSVAFRLPTAPHQIATIYI
jgi:hypothetical protein